MSVNGSKRKKRGESINRNRPSPSDLDLIERLFRFANHAPFTEQKEVYDIFRPHPYVVRVDGEPYLAPLPKAAGVRPFLNDLAHVRDHLGALASRESHALEIVQKEVSGKLGEKLKAFLRVEWNRGNLQLRGEPILDGIEVCFYYPLALLFHHRLERSVKICEAYLKDEDRPCGKFFLITRNHRAGCSSDHKKLIAQQKNIKRVQKHYESEGRPTTKKRRPHRQRSGK